MQIEVGVSGVPRVVDGTDNGVLIVDIYLQPLAKMADADIGRSTEKWALRAARSLEPGTGGGLPYGVRLICDDAERLRTRAIGQE